MANIFNKTIFKLVQIGINLGQNLLQLFEAQRIKNSLNFSPVAKTEAVASRNTLISKLEKLVKIDHYASYMQQILTKNKLRILVGMFCAIFVLCTVALLIPLIIDLDAEKQKVDTISIETKSNPLKALNVPSELDQKKAQLEKLQEEQAELDAILAEKVEIYERIKLLQTIGGYEIEIQEALYRNQVLSDSLRHE